MRAAARNAILDGNAPMKNDRDFQRLSQNLPPGPHTVAASRFTQVNRFCRVAAGLALVALVTGCPPPGPPAYPFVTMQEAVRCVNLNNALLGTSPGGIRSPVDASGRFREHAGDPAQSFSLAGTLVFRKPRDLVLLLREGMGNTVVMQAGSNRAEYWLWIKPRVNTLWWGEYPGGEAAREDSDEATTQRGSPREGGDAAETAQPATEPAAPCTQKSGPAASCPAATTRVSILLPPPREEMPIRPDHLLEVLGLNELPTDTTGPDGPVYRPEPTRNVLIFLAYDDAGQGYIQKEYHIDRAPPCLVREIIFRRPDGRVQMHAALTDHAAVRGVNALAPRRLRIEWPSAESWLELRMRGFVVGDEPLIGPDNPREAGIRFDREVRVGPEWSEPAGGAPGGPT